MVATADIDARMRRSIGTEFEIEESLMTDDATLGDALGIDSLDMVDLTVVIEGEFGVKLSREELVKARTFGDLKNLIVNKIDG